MNRRRSAVFVFACHVQKGELRKKNQYKDFVTDFSWESDLAQETCWNTDTCGSLIGYPSVVSQTSAMTAGSVSWEVVIRAERTERPL